MQIYQNNLKQLLVDTSFHVEIATKQYWSICWKSLAWQMCEIIFHEPELIFIIFCHMLNGKILSVSFLQFHSTTKSMFQLCALNLPFEIEWLRWASQANISKLANHVLMFMVWNPKCWEYKPYFNCKTI